MRGDRDTGREERGEAGREEGGEDRGKVRRRGQAEQESR